MLKDSLFVASEEKALLSGLNEIFKVAETPKVVQEKLTDIFTRQFVSTAFFPKKVPYDSSFVSGIETPLLQKRAKRILETLKNTPFLKKMLPEHTFDINVKNGAFDAYARTNELKKNKKVQVELLAGVFNSENWPKNFTQKDIDAGVAVMIAHEIGHHVQETLESDHVKTEDFIKKTYKTLPKTHALIRGIEAVCDIVSLFVAHQAGYDPLKYATIYENASPYNTTHPNLNDRKEILASVRELPVPTHMCYYNTQPER